VAWASDTRFILALRVLQITALAAFADVGTTASNIASRLSAASRRNRLYVACGSMIRYFFMLGLSLTAL
jgi:hypothetical protein